MLEYNVEPWPSELLDNHRKHGYFTLCRVIREIYAKTDDPEIKLMARVAYRIGKNFTEVIGGYKNFIEEMGYTVDVTADEWQSLGFIGRITKNEA